MGNHINFNCVSSSPPQLEEIVAQMRKATRTQPFFQKADLRGFALSADRKFYDPKGPQSALTKFLVGTGMILEDTGHKCYPDFDRCKVVLKCCKEGKPPEAAADSKTRLAELKKLHAASRLAKAPAKKPVVAKAAAVNSVAATQQEADQPPAADLDALVAGEAAAEADVANLNLDAVADATAANDSAVANANAIATGPKFVLYLTPKKYDLWETFCALARDSIDKQKRFALASDPHEFHATCASQSLTCSPVEYADGIDYFVKMKMIEEIRGKLIAGKRAFRFLVNWEEFHYIKIEDRLPSFVDEFWFGVVQLLQNTPSIVDDQSRGMTIRVAELVQSQFPILSQENIRKRIFGNPWGLSGGLGIITTHEETGNRLLCWPGFEPVELLHKTGSNAPVPAEVHLVEAKYTIKVCPSQAGKLLELADGNPAGGLTKVVAASFLSTLRHYSVLSVTRNGNKSTWAFHKEAAKGFRFEAKKNSTIVSHVTHLKNSAEERMVPEDQWRKDLEAIAAKGEPDAVVRPIASKPVAITTVPTDVGEAAKEALQLLEQELGPLSEMSDGALATNLLDAHDQLENALSNIEKLQRRAKSLEGQIVCFEAETADRKQRKREALLAEQAEVRQKEEVLRQRDAEIAAALAALDK